MSERLTQSPEIPFWKGVDIVVPETVRFQARRPQETTVLIPKGGLPDFIKDRSELALKILTSTRSIAAQVGLEVDDLGDEVYDAIKDNPRKLDDPEGIKLPVKVRNYGERDVELEKDAGLFRFYYPHGAKQLTNGDLERNVENGAIVLGGEFGMGQDWFWAKDTSDKGQINGVYIKIGDNRRHIPADVKEPVIRIPKVADKSFRNEIDSWLEPIEPSFEPSLWIGETEHPIVIKGNLEAVLHPLVVKGTEGRGAYHESGLHINSPVLDGPINGIPVTNHKVRFEIFSATDPESMPNYVLVNFYKA